MAGNIGLAEEGALTLFASGGKEDFDACLPAFKAIASTVHHVDAGEGAAYLKLVGDPYGHPLHYAYECSPRRRDK